MKFKYQFRARGHRSPVRDTEAEAIQDGINAGKVAYYGRNDVRIVEGAKIVMGEFE